MALRVPLLFWPGKPDHDITTICSSSNGEYIVSGDNNGILVKWRLSKNPLAKQKYQPLWMMVASSGSPVISICQIISHGSSFCVAGLQLLSSVIVHYQNI